MAEKVFVVYGDWADRHGDQDCFPPKLFRTREAAEKYVDGELALYFRQFHEAECQTVTRGKDEAYVDWDGDGTWMRLLVTEEAIA